MPHSNKIFKNIVSLSIAEIINKIAVYLYYAYLARVILTNGIGSLSFAEKIISFLILFVSLGIDNYGLRYVSKNKGNLKNFVDNAFTLRFLLCCISYCLLIILVIFLNKEFYVKIVILLVGLNIFSQGLLLNWVFIGLENFKVISNRLILTSFLNIFGIFIFVKSKNDIVIAALVIAFTMLINTLLLIWYYNKKINKLNLVFNLNEWKRIVLSSLPIGITYIIVNAYNN